jgi:hypothetical protein
LDEYGGFAHECGVVFLGHESDAPWSVLQDADVVLAHADINEEKIKRIQEILTDAKRKVAAVVFG